MCQFDELVLFCVVPRFIWDSLKEDRDGKGSFSLYRHNMEDNVVLPEAVLGHQEKSAKERLPVMFHFPPAYPSLCVFYL